MPSFNSIASDKLVRLIGLPSAPRIVDVRDDRQFACDPRLIPGAIRRSSDRVREWAPSLQGSALVVVSAEGGAASEALTAWLRHEGCRAEALEGGMAGWQAAGLPLIPETKLPPRDPDGCTIWITRARPKVDRIACPWLIRRFVDPAAVFLFVSPAEVRSVAAQLGGAPFDIEADDVTWSHRGERCTFDVMVEELGLHALPALNHLATIVRGADTGRPDLAPECAGLLAASLGLSRMFTDDLEQLEAGMLFYDSLYRWCRDATDEMHDWTSHRPSSLSPKRGRDKTSAGEI